MLSRQLGSYGIQFQFPRAVQGYFSSLYFYVMCLLLQAKYVVHRLNSWQTFFIFHSLFFLHMQQRISEPRVWLEACVQVLLSLHLCSGVVLTMASRTKSQLLAAESNRTKLIS